MVIFNGEKEVVNYLEKLEQVFNTVRIVDPRVNKIIYQVGDEKYLAHGIECYKFWEKGKVCDNCISYQSFQEQRTINKIEYKNDTIYMVIASPIKLRNHTYILELIYDITQTKILMEQEDIGTRMQIGTIYDLNQKTIIDDLTGIYNRRYINQHFSDDIYYAMKNKEKLTVAMLDIDNFKEINDNYGYLVGDLTLKKLAGLIEEEIRVDSDWVARYGGDEFFITFRGISEDRAIMIMNRIKKRLEDTTIEFENNIINITISVGIYTLEYSTKNFNDIIYKLDKNLKKAKKSGKNKIVVSR
ncbi:GGDEF domain-containing protein [Wansuia hejianensis]|uniref:GGDEF domain-containing protein n=1 Tax=Wansuia hejianensis TaxID=2763667 RepID=A0A926EVX0_9FIRM|nr:GGDEF domain-containing protein [Wansuia hejianensis]MBC8589886.1 GGDEF domain-containing protein [Wansuia hejianensis]